MSIFRACTRSSKHVGLSISGRLSRYTSTEAAPSAESNAYADREITIQPTRDVLVADVISGAPAQLRHRSVRIYQPTRNTMQSGSGKTERWLIDFDTLQSGGRWENPLMGYASSADYMQGTRISFRSKEDAIHFSEKQGWDYFVQPPVTRRIPPKNYAENYMYKSQRLRILRTK